MTSIAISPRGRENRLLAALPAEQYAVLAPRLQTVRLKSRQVLVAPQGTIEHVFFMCDAVASLLVRMDDGRSIEGAVIGNEGMAGLAVFLGQDSSPEEVVVQIPGEATQLSAADFRAALSASAALQTLLQGYTLELIGQLARTAGCNSVHSVEKRFARWLLMSRDRVGRDKFPITHHFLSIMLGVRRASVTEAAQAMQNAGLITYRYGQVTIVDGARLEAVACEDYHITRQIFDRQHTPFDADVVR